MIQENEKAIENCLDQLIKTDNENIKLVCERKIEALEKRHLLEEKLNRFDTLDTSFGTAVDQVCNFIQEPVKVWRNGNLEEKQHVLKMVFTRNLSYHKETGFGTIEKSLPFKLCEGNNATVSVMVELRGLEPRTSCMPCKRSSQLSYSPFWSFSIHNAFYLKAQEMFLIFYRARTFEVPT